MDHVKGDYDTEIKSVIGDQVYQAVKSRSQGFSSTTYFVTFADNSSIVIQFCPISRPIDMEAVSSARSCLGCLVPEFQLLTKIQNNSVLVYRMTRLPGDSFSVLMGTPNLIHLDQISLKSDNTTCDHELGQHRKQYVRTYNRIKQKAYMWVAIEI
jgi:hypothetical protein